MEMKTHYIPGADSIILGATNTTELLTSSWNYKQAHGIACKLMELYFNIKGDFKGGLLGIRRAMRGEVGPALVEFC